MIEICADQRKPLQKTVSLIHTNIYEWGGPLFHMDMREKQWKKGTT